MTAEPSFREVQIAAALATFPGSRHTRRRTPEDFERYWRELGRQANAHVQAEMVAMVRLKELQQQTRHTPVATTEGTIHD